MNNLALNYWAECIADSAEEHGVTMTNEQIQSMARDMQVCHDNYGMAFYSPPPSERMADIESDYKRKLRSLQAELEKERENACEAVKIALRLRKDDRVSIQDGGHVLLNAGRTTQIQ